MAILSEKIHFACYFGGYNAENGHFNSNIGEKSSNYAFSVLKMRLFLVISKKKER